MNHVSYLRANGAVVSSKPGGGFGIQGADHLKAYAVANAPAIKAELSKEGPFGIPYVNTAVAFQLDCFFSLWANECPCEERSAALSLLYEWDDACWESPTLGAARIISEWPKMEQLMAGRELSGDSLYSALQQLVRPAPAASAFGAAPDDDGDFLRSVFDMPAVKEAIARLARYVEAVGLSAQWLKGKSIREIWAEVEKRFEKDPALAARNGWTVNQPSLDSAIIVDAGAFGA